MKPKDNFEVDNNKEGPPKGADNFNKTMEIINLFKQNLKNRNNPEYKPDISPKLGLTVRSLDALPIVGFFTILTQAITGRNMAGGKLRGLGPLSGKFLMRVNTGSYIGSAILLGKQGLSLAHQIANSISQDAAFESFSMEDIIQVSIGVVLYFSSRAITAYQASGDGYEIYKKRKTEGTPGKIKSVVQKLVKKEKRKIIHD